MSTSTPKFEAVSVQAKLLSAGGAVQNAPLQTALEALMSAGATATSETPYCAIVTPQDVSLTAGQAWRSFSGAWGEISNFLQTRRDYVRASDLQWPADMQFIPLADQDAESFSVSDIVRSHFAKPPLEGEEVFLLVTPDKCREMLPPPVAQSFIGSFDENFMVRLIASLGTPDYGAPLSPEPAEADVPSHADDPPSANEPTRAWRQWFAKNVKWLKAADVAQESGHQAKNTSATANRWTTEGKIFSVRHGGQLMYPAFQFQHGSPLPVVARILKSLGPDSTGWNYAFFFASPNAYLDGAKPMDKVRDAKLDDTLIALANRYSHPADVF
jgi:hypothetical protein